VEGPARRNPGNHAGDDWLQWCQFRQKHLEDKRSSQLICVVRNLPLIASILWIGAFCWWLMLDGREYMPTN